ncbi:MAG: sugar nucleotide-binding protein [Clostridia bacterium]|nr:sugar nucleotide-binding protein [Clostridia bacterium]
MRILLTGPTGFVGARIMDALPVIPAPSLRGMEESQVRQMVGELEPDVIIHTAALSDIGQCREMPDESYHANVELPLWLVRTGVRTVIFSSDQVYSGLPEPGPYTERQAKPANLYAEHKLEMEQRTLDAAPETVLLRAAWMYDMPRYGCRNRGNFLVNMLRQEEIAFSSTQLRSVTYVREVAAKMEKVLHLPGGVYNFGSENTLSMLDTARWLAETLRLRIRIRDAGPRHDLAMDTGKLKSFGLSFSSVQEGLMQCIRDYSLMEG